MTKVFISILMGLIITSSSFNFHIADFLKVASLTEKFNIDDASTEEIVESNEELQMPNAEETIVQDTQIKKAEIEQPKENIIIKQENNVTTSNIENKTKTESQPAATKKQETKVENKITNTPRTNTQNNQVTQNTQSINTQIQVQKQEQQVQQTPQVTEQPQVKQEEQKPIQEVVPTQPIREVKRNDAMIQKIKTYISTHETERMKKYGYSFVVDPNVVKITNPFTYSEFNMEACLNRIGEYKIYAQDYYVNGQYLETQCFVY